MKEELSVDNSTVAKFATVQTEGGRTVERQVEHYNLDMIISVGYRVKSVRGVQFRKWANNVLREYIIKGYAVNYNRMNQIGEVIWIMKRPKGTEAVYILSYEECRTVIDSMKFAESSDLFGNEKDDSFKGSIGNIYQSFGGEDVYPTLEEKEMKIKYHFMN